MTEMAVVGHWAWDDALVSLGDAIDTVYELTSDPAPTGRAQLLSDPDGLLLHVPADIDAATLLTRMTQQTPQVTLIADSGASGPDPDVSMVLYIRAYGPEFTTANIALRSGVVTAPEDLETAIQNQLDLDAPGATCSVSGDTWDGTATAAATWVVTGTGWQNFAIAGLDGVLGDTTLVRYIDVSGRETTPPINQALSVTGGPFGVAPFVVTLENNANLGTDTLDGDLEIAATKTQPGMNAPGDGFYLDLSTVPDGAVVGSMYANVVEDFASVDVGTVLLGLFFETPIIVGAPTAYEFFVVTVNDDPPPPDVLFQTPSRVAMHRFSFDTSASPVAAGQEMPVYVDFGDPDIVLTAGEVEFMARYFIPPTAVTTTTPDWANNGD